jgi:hypothetical protein
METSKEYKYCYFRFELNSPIFVPGTLLGTLSIKGEGLGVVVGKSAKDGILLKKSITANFNHF